ncbi:MAG: sulfatase modifying factor 1 [Myxococcota bacterium]|jgi:sulfatase modifying factor 1
MTVILSGMLVGCWWPAAPEVPEGMVEIPPGSFIMGRDNSSHADESPAHRVVISGLYIDETLVTVADFRRFVVRTGYQGTAEVLGFGMASWEGLDDWEWVRVPGASWKHPWGPEDPDHVQADDEPVVMVSWDDAVAYCGHLDRRLPTEAEWEYAMRAGAEGRFPWGEQPRRDDGELGLNYWQGEDHLKNELLDGHRYTSPVRAFPPNAWGIYDAAGNAWQWTADWYSAETYAARAAGVVDPIGPDSGWARVARGGSWWCSEDACSAFGLFARGKSRPQAPFNNNGFRCAMDRTAP